MHIDLLRSVFEEFTRRASMTNRFGKPLIDVSQLIVVILAGWMLFNLIETVQYVTANYSILPIEDYWRVPEFWPQYKAFHFGALWRLHNEHRIVFPELTFIADMFLLKGRMYLPLALSGACYLGVWCVLAWTVLSVGIIKGSTSAAGLMLAGVMIFWKGCSSAIATPFEIQFTMLQFAGALSLAMLMRLAESARARYIVLVIGFAVIATYSSGNGMLLWAVLIGGALLLRVRKLHLLSLTLAAIIAVSAYFVGYHFTTGNIGLNLRHPLLEIAFLCSFMSMPFGAFGPAALGIAIGAVNVLMMAVLFAFALWRRLLRSRTGVVLFGLYLFTLLSALLTAAGRLDVNDRAFWLAKAWRYATMPSVAWALLAMALVWLVGVAGSRHLTVVTSLLISAFFFWGFRNAAKWVETTRVPFEDAQMAATMLRNEVFEPSVLAGIFPSPPFVRAQLERLKADRKSIYARGRDKWLGQDLNRLHPQQAPLTGKITRVYPVAGGLQILGWADSTWLSGDHAVLFVDNATGKIAGYGQQPPAGFPAALSGWDMPDRLAFAGFVQLSQPAPRQLSVYVRTFHGKFVQPLEGNIQVPVFEPAGSIADAPVLPGIEWRPDAAWRLKGYKVEAENGPVPVGDIYGSGPEGHKTGMIRIPSLRVPANHCLVLPVLHGISTYGQSVEVQDANTNQPIATLPMLDGQSIWTRWRIPIPVSSSEVAIVAGDEGHEWAQWMAIASPQQCP